MLNTSSSLAGPVTRKAKNGLCDSRRTQFNSLFRKRDAEPVRAFERKSSSTLDRTVPVCIRFDDCHNARRRTYSLFDLVEVCGKIVEIDLSPGRPPGKKLLFGLW